jgi:hypothetical protein
MKRIFWLLLFALLGLSMGDIAVGSADETVDRLLEEAKRATEHLGKDKRPTSQPDEQATSGLNSEFRLREKSLDQYHELRLKEEENELIEVGILCILALVSLAVVLWYLRKTRWFTADHIVNVTGLIFIIQGTIILVLMAKTDEQLTAAIGILGAVAGYLFGTMRRGETREPAPEKGEG